MDLANGFRTLASGRSVYFVDGVVAPTEPCFWAIEIPSNHPEPDCYADTISSRRVRRSALQRSRGPYGMRSRSHHGHARRGAGRRRLRVSA